MQKRLKIFASHFSFPTSHFPLLLLSVLLIVSSVHAQARDEAGRAYYDFGVFAYEDGNYEEAESNLKFALEFNPTNPFYNNYMGKTYMKMERYEDAEKYLTRAYELEPDVTRIRYDLAMLNYKMEKYAGAEKLFTEIADDAPDNVSAQYYAGITLYKQEKYAEAPPYLLRAAEMSPTVRADCYYLAGICYQQTGQADKAVEKFEYIKDHTDSEILKEKALVWIDAIRLRKRALKPYSLYLKLGRQYDDNVRLESEDEESDYATVLYFSGKYDVISRGYYKAGGGYSHYQTWYNGLDDYNLTASIINLYGEYRFSAFTLGVDYTPSFYWLDTDSYLKRHRLKPWLKWRRDNLITSFSYSYYHDDYSQEDDEGKDGSINEVSLDIYHSIFDKKGYLFAGIGYEDKSASDDVESYGQIHTKLGMVLELPWHLNLTVRGKYYDKSYDTVNPIYGVERDDEKYAGEILLSRNLFYDWLGVMAEFKYLRNDSNVDTEDYDRKQITLSLTASY